MLHQDGSPHAWLEGQPELDLIVTMDDATSTIYSAFLVEEEGTASTFQGLQEVLGENGLPSSLYSGRGSHYFFTPKAGGPVDKKQLTQVGRALHRLGIEHIPAYSPEARGRSERMFGTLQGRLPKELKLAGMTTIAAANRFIRKDYLPRHNARFAQAPALPENAFVAADPALLAEILCSEVERVVPATIRSPLPALRVVERRIADPRVRSSSVEKSLPIRGLEAIVHPDDLENPVIRCPTWLSDQAPLPLPCVPARPGLCRTLCGASVFCL